MLTLQASIIPYQQAQQAGYCNTKVPIKTFSRLLASILDSNEEVSINLRFTTLAQNIPVLEGEIKTTVNLSCQRCLQPMSWPLNIVMKLAFLSNEAYESVLSEDYDSIIVTQDETFILQDLIEDELLLALPLTAKHTEDTQCNQEVLAYTPQKNNPFQILDQLKNKEH